MASIELRRVRGLLLGRIEDAAGEGEKYHPTDLCNQMRT